jgi:sigma-E factor negative regulatory protein RseC
MITESGIVTQADRSTAWVKTTRSGACEACTSRESCGTGHDAKDQVVIVKNTLGVEQGNQVVIGLETKPMMFLTFFLYVFPILLLMLGAVIGDSLSPALNMDKSFGAMILGFTFFAMAFLIIRKKQAGLTQKDEFKPFLIRKKSISDSTRCQI